MTTSTPTHEDLEAAWAAGLFDGEGSISANKSTKALEISVGQKGDDVLCRFQRAVKAGRVYRFSDERSSMYQWTVSGAKSQLRVLALLWPYLSDPKKEQARRAHKTLACIREDLQRQVREVVDAYEAMEGVMQS